MICKEKSEAKTEIKRLRNRFTPTSIIPASLRQLRPKLLAFPLGSDQHQAHEQTADTIKILKKTIYDDIFGNFQIEVIPSQVPREDSVLPFLYRLRAPPNIDNVIFYEPGTLEHFGGFSL